MGVVKQLDPPEDDGLTIVEVGSWSKAKHHFLQRYIDAFTTSMKGKKWSGLHYIDLFAGPGVLRLKPSGELIPGSPLIAAETCYPFTRLHLCEKKARNYDALVKRLDRITLPNPRPLQMMCGDANKKVHEVLKEIPDGTLSLAFLDPFGLHLHFETVRVLSQRRTDLIIFFPDHLDALRNWRVYDQQSESNLDRFMGPGADWRKIKEMPKARHAETLRNLYCDQLRTLGYAHLEYERISYQGQYLYLLIYCSRGEMGARLWRGVSEIQPDQQRKLKFDEY